MYIDVYIYIYMYIYIYIYFASGFLLATHNLAMILDTALNFAK